MEIGVAGPISTHKKTPKALWYNDTHNLQNEWIPFW